MKDLELIKEKGISNNRKTREKFQTPEEINYAEKLIEDLKKWKPYRK